MKELKETLVEVFVRSRDLVTVGWLQKLGRQTFEDGTEIFCLAGAIARAAREIAPDEFQTVCIRAYRTIEQFLGSPSVAGWNDEPNRTQDEVISALGDVIDYLRAN